MDNKDQKIWELLGAWESIEPRAGYFERFKARVAARKTWSETLFENIRALLSPKPLFQTVLALGLFIMVFFSGQTYVNQLTTQSLLSNVSEQQWEMLANLETISQMDLVKQSAEGEAI